MQLFLTMHVAMLNYDKIIAEDYLKWEAYL